MRNISRCSSPLVCLSFALAVLFTTISCGGGGASPTSPSSAAGGSSGLGVTTYTYTNDIKPILTSDCIACHGSARQESGYNFTTYQGVMRAVTSGSEQSPLVRATGPQGAMYGELSGNRTLKSQILYDWVVNSHAAQ